jgi:hypothetical protein
MLTAAFLFGAIFSFFGGAAVNSICTGAKRTSLSPGNSRFFGLSE